MEIEKPFKCNVCNAQFTNEDHLQVHKRRHEMSLNLNKSGVQQQQSTIQMEGFVDETPTPTRFFKNCEEVGLFQDLQNVNPFDEQFSKAASATPSTEGEPFDFSLAISSSSVPPSASTSASTASSISSNTNNNNNNANKRRYSDQDTLNTPQVFGYVVTATSSTTNTCSTTSILTPMPPSSVALEGSNSKKSADLTNDSNNFQQTSESKSSSSTETVISVVSSADRVKLSSNKSKVNLKLTLSPTFPLVLQDDPNSIDFNKKAKPTTPIVFEKKAELLERNRAAASRSRQRRKQWVGSLESKCQTLEAVLAQTRAELSKRNAEIQLLRNELNRHSNCDVSRQAKSHNGEITILVQKTVSQPNILRQSSVISSAVSQFEESSPTQVIVPVTVAIPRTKAKRGRPRKGNERRIDPLSFQSTNTETSHEVPFKIQIEPVSRTVVGGVSTHNYIKVHYIAD